MGLFGYSENEIANKQFDATYLQVRKILFGDGTHKGYAQYIDRFLGIDHKSPACDTSSYYRLLVCLFVMTHKEKSEWDKSEHSCYDVAPKVCNIQNMLKGMSPVQYRTHSQLI